MKHNYNPFAFKRTPYGPFAVEYRPQDQTVPRGMRACIYSRSQYIPFEPIISMTDSRATTKTLVGIGNPAL